MAEACRRDRRVQIVAIDILHQMTISQESLSAEFLHSTQSCPDSVPTEHMILTATVIMNDPETSFIGSVLLRAVLRVFACEGLTEHLTCPTKETRHNSHAGYALKERGSKLTALPCLLSR